MKNFLIDASGNQIKPGELIKTFRGETYTVGAIFNTKVECSNDGGITHVLFYPSVMNCKIFTVRCIERKLLPTLDFKPFVE